MTLPVFPPGAIGIIQKRMRDRHVASLKSRMPAIDNGEPTNEQTIYIQSDPRSNESNLDPRELNDSEAIYALMDDRREERDNVFYKFDARCQVSRRSVPYVEGGPAPADDYNDIWDVIIPGGVPDTVVVSQVAIIRPDPDGLKRVYTITHIAQDRLKYIARLTTEVYGLRKAR